MDAPKEAETAFQESLEFLRANWPSGNPTSANVLMAFARFRLDQGEPQRAEPLVREAFEVRTALLPKGDPRIDEAKELLDLCEARNEGSAEGD